MNEKELSQTLEEETRSPAEEETEPSAAENSGTRMRWEEILASFAPLPDCGEAEAWMRSLGMPVSVREIGLTRQDAVDAFVCSRDIRDKYLISSLVWDLGYMDEFAQRLGERDG